MEADWKATLRLADLARGKVVKPSEAAARISGRTVVVFGAGPSLEKDVERLSRAGLLSLTVPVAANGAVTALLAKQVIPALVVSDLDGRVRDLLRAERLGALMVVHGHGDNVGRLEALVPRFRRLLATTQVSPVRGLVYNFGGFTDGDRAVFLAEALKAERVVLAGMDLGETVGRFSKPGLKGEVKASTRKRVKLEIAGELLAWLAGWAKTEILNFTFGGVDIPGIRRVDLQELRRLLRA
ncbi:MAG: 6-hydroxymethyl-7,8-dihydropterin pyrophosphokinase [Candidatus Hecatellales archaeon]|nr:MAG: 6-hydroxymethyl-7,8-dihydropterin pyrophosphokinase [Candidatus Hecatellales archaeon]